MFKPFALAAAVFCGRERFKTSIGQVVSLWVLILIFALTTLMAWELLMRIESDPIAMWFAGSNVLGFFVSCVMLIILIDRIKDGAKKGAEGPRRSLGTTMGRMRGVPLCAFANDSNDEQARFEPMACFLISVVALLCLNVYAWVLFVGSISLAIYEASDEKRETEATEASLAQLRDRLRTTESILNGMLTSAREIVDELHTVAVIETDKDPTSPVGHRIDELIERFRSSYPNLFIDPIRPPKVGSEARADDLHVKGALEIERRLQNLRDRPRQ